MRLVERSHVLGYTNLLERDPAPDSWMVDTIVLLDSLVARPVGGPIPAHPHARQGVQSSGGGSARQRLLVSIARMAS
jgi:hypothetical protein